jgi:hypothetical protein|mmetsp:Transcript_22834/g.39104  ORF Transcript_22834/g.39104 Transcript_22834/m.39104 type:complete len:93 (-) Transcript_22834:555-833(-)
MYKADNASESPSNHVSATLSRWPVSAAKLQSDKNTHKEKEGDNPNENGNSGLPIIPYLPELVISSNMNTNWRPSLLTFVVTEQPLALQSVEI